MTVAMPKKKVSKAAAKAPLKGPDRKKGGQEEVVECAPFALVVHY